MQNKGIIRLFAILFGLVSIYQLSFTFITNQAEDKARAYAVEQVSNDVENYGDLRQEAKNHYLDSIGDDPLIAGITYNEAREKQLNKGLDLKGGISVILQISVNDLLRELSNHSHDPAFEKALAQADKAAKTSQDTYLELFFEAFNKIPGAKLASPDIFANKQLSGAVTFNMTNQQVQQVLSKQVDESIKSAFRVLGKRVNQFGVAQPNIQRLGNSGRILIELPGAEDIARAKKLLQTTAQLEFWHVYQAQDFTQFFRKANAKLKQLRAEETSTKKASTDSTKVASDSTASKDIEALLSSAEKDDDQATVNKDNPLLGLVQSFGRKTGPILAQFKVQDTAKVNSFLQNPQVRALLPASKKYARFAWGKPNHKTGLIALYALKSNRENIPDLTGSVVTSASQTFDRMSHVAVSLEMNAKGALIWEKMTGQAYKAGTQIAIVLDNTVYSAPGVTTGAIAGGRSQITGNFSIEEGKDLATVLEAGKLPAKANIAQIEIVGPSLGATAIQHGMTSFAIALLIILIYVFFYYGKAGLFADVALLVNLLFIFGILAGIGAVLTLPGIAGIVLTIGMSVDANVLIFERIREELRNGKSQVAAIKDGFKNALSSILDANITTFLTGLILLIFGTGAIKGFAVTLLIGICTSLFTAIFITRLCIDNYGKNGKTLAFSSKATKNFLANVQINFTKKNKLVYTISGVALLISIISISTRGLDLGVDFVGGRSYTVRFDHEVDAPEVEKDLTATFGSASAKIYGSNNQLKITTKYKVDEEGEKVDQEIKHMLFNSLQSQFPKGYTFDHFKIADSQAAVGLMSSIKVGPSIADDIKTASFWAVMASFVAIFIYILYRFKKWQFSIGAVIALFHDSIILIGVFSLFYNILPFLEVGQSFIAGILTVIGYSINDTVVVFDRIREYFHVHPKWGLKKNVNASISSTLGRTLNTSATTLLVLLSIFIFGSESIRGFVFAILVGIVIGTYSSIFVASPIMYDIMKRKGDDIIEREHQEAISKRKQRKSQIK